MSTFDTDNTLLREMLGKGGLNVVFTTAAQTDKGLVLHTISSRVSYSITYCW